MMHLQVVTTALSVSCFLHLSELQRRVKSITAHYQRKLAIGMMSRIRFIVWRAGEPSLSTLNKWRNGMIAPSKLGEHSRGGIRGPAKKEQPMQHLIVLLAWTFCIETECTYNCKAEIRRARNLRISLIG